MKRTIFIIVGAMLAGCGGMPTAIGGSGALAQQKTYAVRPACRNAQRGEAQCLVIVQSKSGISRFGSRGISL
jgi:starvation-inducible outer membrane lipoprotein